MNSIERVIETSWRHRVLFSDHVFDPANPVLKDTIVAGQSGSKPRQALIVVDASLVNAQPRLLSQINGYFAAHSNAVHLTRIPLVFDGGEQVKSCWAKVSEVHAVINWHHIDRHSYVIAVGGGALLDMVGLAAATAHRGVRHIRIPTTTLSQCDSGVGVKNSINAFGKKNFIGTFVPPFAVINDFQLLATLPPRDKRAGYAEAVKVSCIRDLEFFETLERDADALARFEPAAMRRLIRRCAELHLDHIAYGGDPFENGSARPLDFGHWSAHKLEQLSGFERRHGEAVAIGIALDVVYSRRAGFLPAEQAERVLRLLEALGFELFGPDLLLPGPEGELRLLEGLEEFREHLGGELSLTLLRAIGQGFEAHEMNPELVIQSIAELETRWEERRPTESSATV